MKAEPLVYNWENDMNVLYRLPSGKVETIVLPPQTIIVKATAEHI